MGEKKKRAVATPEPQQLRIRGSDSLDFLVNGRLVAVGTELLQFQPFGGVAAVLLSGVTGHTWRPLGGVGPAFGALESDHDPDALVFSHEGRCAAGAMRKDKLTPYLAVVPPPS